MARREEAIAHFERRARDDPMDPEPHYSLAALFRSKGDLERHAHHARVATLTKDGGPKVWNEMGLALLEQGKRDEARDLFEQVIHYWPTFPWSYVNMSVVTARGGKYGEALTFALKALEHIPDDAALHRNAAKIYEAMGKTSEALVHYEKALALEPTDTAVTHRVAMLSLGKGHSALAASYYERYRALTGQHFDLKL